jgi:ferritin-like metal-binding protein YciE
VSENKKSPTINAAIIFAAQKAEHYEIASYGTLREWAEQLDNTDAVDLIEDILDEEKAADQKLTKLAVSAVNAAAQESVGHTA